MIYTYFALQFLTPVHIGNAHNGGSLDTVQCSCSADTFFSALCSEAAMLSKEILDTFIGKVKTGDIVISSLFPYYIYNEGNSKEDVALFLPRPYLLKDKIHKTISFTAMKKMATEQKNLKKINYIRASFIENYLSDINPSFTTFEEPVFGTPLVSTRVNCQEGDPIPYFVGSFVFAPHAGLYFIMKSYSEDEVDFVVDLLNGLSLSGIGGKRSSGYGKFEIRDIITLYSEDEVDYKDEKALIHLLENNKGKYQVALSPILPSDKEQRIIKEGFYKVKKRSGFLSGSGVINNIKRDNIHMLSEGSVFPKALEGRLLQTSIDGLGHPIYRYGKGLFVGINI